MSTPPETKLYYLFAAFQSKLFFSISELVPQLIKDAILTKHDNVKEAVISALPSYSDIVTGNKKTAHSTELQFKITGLIETKSAYFK